MDVFEGLLQHYHLGPLKKLMNYAFVRDTMRSLEPPDILTTRSTGLIWRVSKT